MRISTAILHLSIFSLLLISTVQADEIHAYRTDENQNEKLPWFQVVNGEFPPADSDHYFCGELIKLNHLKRSFVVRNDRNDTQNRSHWDLPVAATMLPYGSIYLRGSPAALEDIPLGTHLHGFYYARGPNDNSEPLEGWHNRKSYEIDFTRCIRLEDDFSYYSRQNQLWRIDDINPADKKLTVTLMQDGNPVGAAKIYDLIASTLVWQGRCISSVKNLASGQIIQLNSTWATLYGPGRVTEIWIDEESRKLASELQMNKHHVHTKDQGLAGWIDAVDNRQRILTITLFDGVDPKLFEELVKGQSAGIAVALESLMTHDPVNDRKSGPVLEINEVPKVPGSSGVQIQIQPSLLLEGYRPDHIVRVYPSGWPVVALPLEKQHFGHE